jgi:hypothetical protein
VYCGWVIFPPLHVRVFVFEQKRPEKHLVAIKKKAWLHSPSPEGPK